MFERSNKMCKLILMYCITGVLHPRKKLTRLLGNVPSLSIAFTWVTLVPIGSPSRTVSCSRSVNNGISSLTSSSMMNTVASDASCWAPLFWKMKTREIIDWYAYAHVTALQESIWISRDDFSAIRQIPH